MLGKCERTRTTLASAELGCGTISPSKCSLDSGCGHPGVDPLFDPGRDSHGSNASFLRDRPGAKRHDGVAIFGEPGIKIDKRRDAFTYSIRDATDDHSGIGLTAENDIVKFFKLDQADDFLDVGGEIDIGVE